VNGYTPSLKRIQMLNKSAPPTTYE